MIYLCKPILALLVGVVSITGCLASNPVPPIKVATAQSSVTPTKTSAPTQTTTFVLTPFAYPTLSNSAAQQAVADFMRANGSCSVPCFWGIVPGESTLADSVGILGALSQSLGRGDIFIHSKNSETLYQVDFTQKDQMFIGVELWGFRSDMLSVHAYASGLSEERISKQDWLAFGPESMLRAYGKPNRVEFYVVEGPGVDGGAVNPSPFTYGFIFYYDQFILQYEGGTLNPTSKTRLCPSREHQIRRFDLWLGSELKNTPSPGTNLEKLTTLSIPEFYNLMTGDSKKACFNLDLSGFQH